MRSRSDDRQIGRVSVRLVPGTITEALSTPSPEDGRTKVAAVDPLLRGRRRRRVSARLRLGSPGTCRRNGRDDGQTCVGADEAGGLHDDAAQVGRHVGELRG